MTDPTQPKKYICIFTTKDDLEDIFDNESVTSKAIYLLPENPTNGLPMITQEIYKSVVGDFGFNVVIFREKIFEVKKEYFLSEIL